MKRTPLGVCYPDFAKSPMVKLQGYGNQFLARPSFGNYFSQDFVPAGVCLYEEREPAPIMKKRILVALLAVTASLPGQPAMLVRQGPHEAELLIVDSGARIIFPGEGAGR